MYPALKDEPSELHGRLVGNPVHLMGTRDRENAAKVNYAPHGPYTHDVPPDDRHQSFAGPGWGDAKRLLTQAVDGFPKPPGRLDATGVIPDDHFAADFQLMQYKGASQARKRLPDEEELRVVAGAALAMAEAGIKAW